MKFIIDVPEGRTDTCSNCPFIGNLDVCKYLAENDICTKYDFQHLHLEEINDTI